MKRNPILRTLGSTIGAAVMLMALPAFAQKNPERDAFFDRSWPTILALLLMPVSTRFSPRLGGSVKSS